MANRIFAYEKDAVTGQIQINQYEGNYDDYMAKSPFYAQRGTIGKGTGGKSMASNQENGNSEDKEKKSGQKPRTEKLKMTYN